MKKRTILCLIQLPELPAGCEITALTMVLNYYGTSADKVEMATGYLPTLTSAELYYGEDGKLYGQDINEYFIGNPTAEEGIICGTRAIVSAANAFLEDQGREMRAVDKTGITSEELYQLVAQDIPAVVWVTIGIEERIPRQGWYTENGEHLWFSIFHVA